MRNLILFIPQELVLFLFLGAGFAMIVGAKRIAMSLLGAAMAVIFLPVLLAPIFNALPGWLLTVVLIVSGLMLLCALFQMVFGKQTTDRFVGTLLVDMLRFLLLAPLAIRSLLTILLFLMAMSGKRQVILIHHR